MNNEDIKEYIDKFIKPAQKRDLLDRFAGQALIGEIISDVLWVSLGNSGTSHEGLVKNAYNYAETMLQEREKRIGGQDETNKETEETQS